MASIAMKSIRNRFIGVLAGKGAVCGEVGPAASNPVVEEARVEEVEQAAFA